MRPKITKNTVLKLTALSLAVLLADESLAALNTASTNSGTGGTELKAAYDWFVGLATGYGGRAVSIVGGLIGLGWGALKVQAMPALIGFILAIFGVLGPSIINSIYTGALI